MSLQDSTFNTAHVLDNEIIKANDFEYAFEKIAENVSKATQMILESNQDFVINGKVLPYEGMDVQISPIYGVCKQNGLPFGRTETAVMEYRFEESNSGRVDIIEVKGAWETFDNQQRAFNDPDTNVQTYQYVDTKKLMRPVYQIKQGVEGAAVAPSVDSGWVKLAEVVIRAGATEILEDDIKNITSDVAGLANSDWTNDTTATYNIGYISDVNARFRVQHNADGTHKENVINTDSLSIGVGSKQVNGSVLPVGGNVSIPTQTITPTDSLLSVYTKIAAMITSFYNLYMKYGEYNFKGGIALSDIADETGSLVDPFVIMPDDGAVIMKIGDNVCLTIDSDGKLSTNGYTASASNHIITKAVSDALKQDITVLANRVTDVETRINGLDVSANNVISNKFAPDNTSIYAATTANITLQGSQVVDGITPAQGVNVLVKNQTNPKENGVYVVSSNSVWLRLSTLSTPDDLVGKIFAVSNGTTNAGKMFYSPQENFLNGSDFGTDDIIFSEYNGTPKPIANKVMVRDYCGRAQVAAPATACDIARKQEIDNLYGNTVGTALGTAAVGTATTFARSDHVHPISNCICMDWFSGNCDRPVMISTVAGTCCSWQNATLGPAVACKLTFNPATGVLKAACFCGTATVATSAGSATTATTATNVVNGVHKYNLPISNNKWCYIKIKVSARNNTAGSFYITDHNMDALLNLDAGVGKYLYGSYGSLGASICTYDKANSNCFWLRYTSYWSPVICSADSFSIICETSTAPSGITFTNFQNYEAPNASYATSAGCACCAKTLTADGTAHVTAGNTDEVNIFSCNSTHYAWLNYRGGTTTICVGAGQGNAACLGTVVAKTFCGCLCGNACYAECTSCACYALQASSSYTANEACCAGSLSWHAPVLNTDFKIVGCGLCALKSFFYMPKSMSINPSPTAAFSCINMRYVNKGSFFAGCSCANDFLCYYYMADMY